jgi:hypothetical protein
VQLESFLVGKLLDPVDPIIASSFADLAPDVIAYNRSSFVSRFRSFSAFRWDSARYVASGESEAHFNQRRAFHTDYNAAAPNPLSDRLIQSGAMAELLAEVTRGLPIERSTFHVGVNQIRVVADDDHMGSPAPGLHQDGYDYSCHLNVTRRNVSGGTSLISKSRAPEDLVLEHNLQPGEFVFFNDRAMFHTASPVCRKIGGHLAWRDMLIFDFVRA